MGSEPRFEPRSELIDLPVLQKFKLYATNSNFYLIGSDEKKTFRRILKIDRTDPNELNLFQDPTKYTNQEIRELKKTLIAGNKKSSGFKAVTNCYGIIGFVTFLEPYYMLVITKRKKVGEICGHTIYAIAETQMIKIPHHSSVQTRVADSETELRCKKLLQMVDLSKNFYFSYTYHLMYNLQTNISNTERGNPPDKAMFVWNTFLTHGIRRILDNTIWTVALIYGFFQQTKCFVSGEKFVLTVIARRSRRYAGTRYLRRGINDTGSVANEVETEQIVSKEVPEGQKIPITSVVQMRGSIPLFWSQKTSALTPQPKIILDKKDADYVTTQHHFEDLRQRYGDRILILNLLKKEKHRESILGKEFAKAIKVINNRVKKNRLRAIHFDLSKHSQSGKADSAFNTLCTFAKKALELNLFFCEAPSGVGAVGVLNESDPLRSQDEEASSSDNEAVIIMVQNGVMRTNCIDCLDRTNVAQYAHGLVALAHQLHILGITGPPVVDLNNPLAKHLMEVYQKMGDAIAMQYGGSEAHRKLFCDLRGDWNMVNRHHDKMIAISRHYNNAFEDSEKQNAINVFLGHFRPQFGDSDRQNFERISSYFANENMRPLIRRSFSDNLLLAGDMNLEEVSSENPLPLGEGLNGGISEANLEFPLFETEPAFLNFRSTINNEEHLRGPGSSQIFPGSSSRNPIPGDIPGFAHSYEARFTPAEELLESYSSNESVTSTSVDLGSWGYSMKFSQWVKSEGAL